MNKHITKFLDFIESNVKRVNPNKRLKYFENGMEEEDFTELIHFNRDLCDSFLN